MTVEVVKVAEDGWTVPLGKPPGHQDLHHRPEESP
jgi:hypothetical protein